MKAIDRTFWKDSAYARKEYVEPPPDDETVASIQLELGYRLPAAYVALARVQNGGIPVRTRHRVSEPTSWADDHVAINGIFAIGRDHASSLCGECGSQFWVTEWGYPDIGVYFADCPSAGHDMLCLDYRTCGRNGEPQVVHVDQERDYRIVVVAPSFAAFLEGLEEEEAFEE